MITERQFYAGAAALLLASVLAVYPPGTANAGAVEATTVAAASTMHDGVDWSRVAVKPVDTGATVGAYER